MTITFYYLDFSLNQTAEGISNLLQLLYHTVIVILIIREDAFLTLH